MLSNVEAKFNFINEIYICKFVFPVAQMYNSQKCVIKLTADGAHCTLIMDRSRLPIM